MVGKETVPLQLAEHPPCTQCTRALSFSHRRLYRHFHVNLTEMANVLLLRAPTTDAPDKYEDALRIRGYHPLSVPVLETVLVRLPELAQLVAAGPEESGLGGVVVTSARACEAWWAAVSDLVQSDVATDADWSRTPFYAVGEATASALASIKTITDPAHALLAPLDIRGASQSGTSEKLARFILSDLPPPSHPIPPSDPSNPTPASNSRRTLLYLTGDKNRDTLPSILHAGGVALRPLQVYATQGASSFAGDLRQVVEGVKSGFDNWWIVYFAPSAADFVTPVLRCHFRLPSALAPAPSSSSSSASPLTHDSSSNDSNAGDMMTNNAEQESCNSSAEKTSTICIAAIGHTTASFLRDMLHLRVDIVPPKPGPEALAQGISSFDAPGAS